MKYLIAYCIALLFCGLSCNKKFDEPLSPKDPQDIVANTSIKALKALHMIGGYEQVKDDLIISGIVVGNDKSGNLYKQICVQDASGGISVLLDASNVYAQFPVGRRIFIRCKGLWLSDYGRLIQLGMKDNSIPGNPSLTGIPAALFNDYIVKGSLDNTVVPKIVTISQLHDSLQSTLIQLNNVEYIPSDTSRTYADTSSAKSAVNLMLTECSGMKVATYTSGYASFAGLKPPQGNGSLTALYFIYRTTPELIIRDTSDVKLYGPRCAASATEISIASLRKMYNGADIALGNQYIRGVVISDASNKNIAAGNIYVQQGNSGIALYYGTTANVAQFNVGDSIVANLAGGVLQNYNGLLEVSLPATTLPGTAIATGRTIVPQLFTIQQLNNQVVDAECTLVKIVNATATSGTFGGSKTLEDATGSLTLYTAAAATFAIQNLPAGSADWVGIPTRYNNAVQLQIRNLNDISNISSANPTGIILNTSPLLIDFNNVEAVGLPKGVFLFTGATTKGFGSEASFTKTKASWTSVGVGFKNFASATGLSAADVNSATKQDAAANRAIGVRQTSAAGYDPGASFVFQLNDTKGKSNLKMNFLLQSLDNSIGRTTVWTVDYAIGEAPNSFTTVTSLPITLATSGTWANTPVTVNFGNALDKLSNKIWIRISSLTATTGSGSRPSTAIDDVQFSWQ